MDFRAFPFDKQFCKINLYVGGYSKRDGTLKNTDANKISEIQNFKLNWSGILCQLSILARRWNLANLNQVIPNKWRVKSVFETNFKNESIFNLIVPFLIWVASMAHYFLNDKLGFMLSMLLYQQTGINGKRRFETYHM